MIGANTLINTRDCSTGLKVTRASEAALITSPQPSGHQRVSTINNATPTSGLGGQQTHHLSHACCFW
jgi:hypothetical protein